MKTLVSILLILLATPLAAQQMPGIIHEPPPCLRAERQPLLEARLETEGTPRVYFRQRGADSWCFVDGERLLDKAIVILPEMPKDVHLEYFFVTYVEDRITGRSPEVYTLPVQSDCQVPVGRHTGILTLDCEGGNAIAVGMTVGFGSQEVEVSPSNPDND